MKHALAKFLKERKEVGIRPLESHMEDAFKKGFLAGVQNARENIPRESLDWWEGVVEDFT